MSNKMRVKVIHGEHKDKVGTLTGIFWAANTAQIQLDDGDKITVKLSEITTIK